VRNSPVHACVFAHDFGDSHRGFHGESHDLDADLPVGEPARHRKSHCLAHVAVIAQAAVEIELKSFPGDRMNTRLNTMIVLLAGGVIAASSSAAEVIATFATTVSFVNTAAPGFPPSLSGVTVGTAVTGVIRYDAAAPAVSNPFPAPWNLATRYQPPGMTVSLAIGGVTLNTWSGPLTAFVWNNDSISGPVVDALIYQNLASAGSMLFQIGNLNMSAATFANESLPAGTISGGLICELWPSTAGPAFLRTNGWSNMTFAPVPLCPADISPAPNGDDTVNVQDLLAVIGAWGPCGNPSNCPADLAPANGDDVVNVQDLLAVIGAWGACP